MHTVNHKNPTKNQTKHERQEPKNYGIYFICQTGFFRKGYKDFMTGESLKDYGHLQIKGVAAQSAYELGRLFAAYCKGINKFPKQWYRKGYKKWTVHQEVPYMVIIARSSGAFC